MKQKEKLTLRLLAAALAVLMLSALFAHRSATLERTEYYDTQLKAVHILENCFSAVKGYKEELGISLSPHDLHETGLLGEEFTGITTTIGALEAKRTTAWPDMAALCVRMLHEAGVQPGDKVGAGFSGSFPGMNLAMVAACEAMGAELICISSVGASTYGANNPELTFPEMLHRLAEDGIIHTRSAAVTMGGDFDIGMEMIPELSDAVRFRLREAGLNLVEIKDFTQNLAWRESLYEQTGPLDCFVAVGGNLTSLGRGEEGATLGQGVMKTRSKVRLDEDSGLVQRYMARGIPVVNLLNIKQIMAEYGMPFDPQVWPETGTSAAYSTIHYRKEILVTGLGISGGLLALCLWLRRRPVSQII